jgi:hypothetical protein
MTESAQDPSGSSRQSAPVDAIFDGLRKGFEAVCSAVTPPEEAARHFREARIEVWRGVRALVDHHIDRLSRNTAPGSRVVVE